MESTRARERHFEKRRLEAGRGIERRSPLISPGRVVELIWREIGEEMEAKLPFMLCKDGCIPFIDHLVPPEVSWGNFRYYRERLLRV